MPQILKGMMSGKYILLSAGKNIIIMLTGCAAQPPAHSMYALHVCTGYAFIGSMEALI